MVHVGMTAANTLLPGRLRVKDRLAETPRFLRQVFYVHWVYLVIVLGLLATLCFGFAPELAGGSWLGEVAERVHCRILAAADPVADSLLRPGDAAGVSGTRSALPGSAGGPGGDFWCGGVGSGGVSERDGKPQPVKSGEMWGTQ